MQHWQLARFRRKEAPPEVNVSKLDFGTTASGDSQSNG